MTTSNAPVRVSDDNSIYSMELEAGNINANSLRAVWGMEPEPETQRQEEEPAVPRVTKHAVVESLKFRIAGAPRTSTSDGYGFKPTKCVVEKREQGIRLVVEGPASNHDWFNRTQKYNIIGYPDFPSPPEWLLELWGEAQRRAKEGDGND